jgi:hypothetical protein
MIQTRMAIRFLALGLLTLGTLAQAASVQGTVTNKTTGKPAAGDAVLLVDVQAGMQDAAHATTDSRGRYTLQKPGAGPYLVRVMHQGAGYFIAAPDGNQPGDISVYDVAAKVAGVGIVEDVYGVVEAVHGQLQVIEQWVLTNPSQPGRTQWSAKNFEIVLPPEATVGGASAQRPGGLPTTLAPDPTSTKGHYTFNFPIEPDQGEKHTLIRIEYQIPYSDKYTFHPQVTLPAKTVWVVLPKSMKIAGSSFQSAPQDPGMQTFVAHNIQPGSPLEFTLSGEGALPRDSDPSGGGQSQAASGQPGGGIGAPIGTPDPLSKYKLWILGGLVLLLLLAASLLLRRPAGSASAPAAGQAAPPAPGGLLPALKDELFQLESDRLAGKITEAEYAEQKAALEIVLKRALTKSDE